MRVAVLVKVALDPNLMKVEASGDVSVRQTSMAIAEYDRNAVQAALDLRDKLGGGQVVALSASTWGMSGERRKDYEGALREALAMGVDEAHAIMDDSLSGIPLETAGALAALAKSLGGFDLYVAGEGSSDMVSGQVAPMLAAMLGLPAVTYVKRAEVVDGSLRLTRDLEDRLETVRAGLPLVISVTGESSQPRLPTLMQIRRAFSKPLRYHTLSELGASPIQARRSALRAMVQKRKNVYIDGSKPEEAASKLIDALIEEGVIRR
ncbi:MAG: electron transfer flavoprotein subunit beta/FixA family protein [Conexivisphaera sp.]